MKPLSKNAHKARVIAQPQMFVIALISPSVSINERIVARPTPIDVFALFFISIERIVPTLDWLVSKNIVQIAVPIGQTIALEPNPLNVMFFCSNWKLVTINTIAQTTEKPSVIKI
jgi:hypothetical protein